MAHTQDVETAQCELYDCETSGFVKYTFAGMRARTGNRRHEKQCTAIAPLRPSRASRQCRRGVAGGPVRETMRMCWVFASLNNWGATMFNRRSPTQHAPYLGPQVPLLRISCCVVCTCIESFMIRPPSFSTSIKHRGSPGCPPGVELEDILWRSRRCILVHAPVAYAKVNNRDAPTQTNIFCMPGKRDDVSDNFKPAPSCTQKSNEQTSQPTEDR